MTSRVSTSGDDQSSVIGRYAAPGEEDDRLVEVVLLNFPLQLFLDSRRRHDDLMREFALLAIRPPDAGARPLPHRLMELINILGRRYGGAGERGDRTRDEAAARGELSMDLRYHVPTSLGPAMQQLADLMVEADGFCGSEQLLTLAPTVVDSGFRQWFCQQFIDQTAGCPPTPWDGPLISES